MDALPDCRRVPRVKQRRPLSAFLTWLSGMGAIGVVVTGWWVGKPLTPELIAVLGVVLSWSFKMELGWNRRLADHSRAVHEIGRRHGVPDAHVETVYAVLEDEIGRERRRQLPRGRSR